MPPKPRIRLECGKHFRHSLGKPRKYNTTLLETTNADGTTTAHITKSTLAQTLASVYKKCYQLTEKTTFMVQPMLRFVGYTGLTPSTNSILEGSFPNPNPYNQDLADFLTATKRHPLLDTATETLSTTITPQDFHNTFSKTVESKASSPSNRHYGIYKAMSTDPYLFQVGAAMMSIPYMTGYAPTRWQTTCALAVPKKIGSTNPEDTRAVILQEGDMNKGHQIHTRRLQHQTQKLNAIPPEQYAVKGGNCTSPAIVEKLSLDIIRQFCIPATVTFIDAQANYDRIVHSVVALCTLRLGLNPKVLQCVISTLQVMTYLIKTGLGTAHGFGPSAIPYKGTTQGSCFSPIFWVCISAILLQILRKYNCGVHFVSPISKTPTTFAAVSFVDDTKIIIADSTGADTKTSLMAHTVFILNKWCGILHVTGGAIRPDKSRFWFITHIWTTTGWKYATIQENNVGIVLPDPDGNYLPVT